MRLTRWLCPAIALVLLVGITPANAQLDTGNLYIEVEDTEGNALPGVSVTISGQGADRVEITNNNGQARFLGLSPGSVQLTASLDGFSTVEYPSVVIRVNANTAIEVALSPAVEEVITVTSETPLLDERKIQAGSRLTQIELEKIPSARDPWSVLTQTPGVSIDRINVGGDQSGQQSAFRAPATTSDENDFLVDGVQVTDMVASGGSSTYFDFDQFTEMQFGTGGADVTKATAGVSVNLVTKRGTNEFRGSARFLVTDSDGLLFLNQSDADAPALPPGQSDFQGNRINKIEEWGFEAGGPAIKDKLWFWGSHGQNDIKNITGIGAADDTILTNTAFKVNAQLGGSNSALGSWNNGDKEKFGRNVSRSRPPDTAWNQRGPSAIIKFQDTHVFSSNFFLGGGYNKVDGGFSLISPAVIREGIENAPQAHRNAERVWEGSYLGGGASRPQEELKIDGNYFFSTGDTNHELKIGARLRETERSTSWKWANDNAWSLDAFDAGKNPALLFTQRGDVPDVSQEYTSMWVQDTISSGNFTINVGFRYDLQDSTNEPFSSGANPWFPNLHPNVDYEGGDPGFDWQTISPRIGVTYALGEERKTLLRASYSSFPEQLDAGGAARVNPAGTSYITLQWYDTDGDGEFSGAGNLTGDPSHTDTANIVGYDGWDPNNPTALSNPNRNDPGYDPEITEELLLGIEHALLPEFVIGGTITLRNTSDIAETRTFVNDNGTIRTATRNDYVREDGPGVTGTLPDGTPYSVPVFALALPEAGGSLLLNGSREVDYLGYGINFTKRLSNQWMARGYVQFGEAEWSVPQDYIDNSSPNPAEFQTDVDGALFGEAVGGGSGAFGNVFTQSTWQFNVSGLYQVAPDRPWGFNIAANVFGREGYPVPYFHQTTLTDGNTYDISVVNDLEDFRLDDIYTVDLRLDKEFSASGDVAFTVGLDLFNALNENFVMQRERDAGAGVAGFVDQTLSPRVWRASVRLTWR